MKDPLEQCWAWLHAADLGNGLWRIPGVQIGGNADSGRAFALYAVPAYQTLQVGQAAGCPRGPHSDITVIRR